MATVKSVTYVLTSISYAGAQTQVVSLAKRFKARQWDVRLIFMMPPEPLTQELDAAGIPWASLNMARGSLDISALLKFRNLIKDWQPTIVHSHMIHANFLARASRLMTAMPILISTAHNINEGGRARMLIYRATDFLSEHTTNVSQAAVDRYIAVGAAPKNKISLMRNGIDTSRFRWRADKRLAMRDKLGLASFTFLAVGRFDDQKDFPTMLNAFQQVVEYNKTVKLLLVGEGPHEADLKALVSSLGLDTQVQFLGVRSDIPDLMTAVDAYLMSSIYEGLPMVLLEAAASGLPIVATDVGGNREIVIQDKNGFLVPAQTPTALAEAILQLLAKPEEARQEMGDYGRHYVLEHYDLEAVVNAWEDLYTYWLNRKGLLQLV